MDKNRNNTEKLYTEEDLESAYRHGKGNGIDAEAGLCGDVSFDQWFEWHKLWKVEMEKIRTDNPQ